MAAEPPRWAGGMQQIAPGVHLKLAIVGRRNTGESTFINALAQEERMIVSEVPGTTRDSVDVHFEREDAPLIHTIVWKQIPLGISNKH